jgi:hypothetical protein
MSPLAQRLAATAGLVVGLTALGALIGVLAPGLADGARPHPALNRTFGTAAGILAENLRVLAAPFLLWFLRLPSSHFGRRAGDVLILAIVAINTLTVGVELGHWRGQLIPYLPQLPLEWAALTIAVGAWLTVRNGHGERRRLAHLAAATVVLLVCAAIVETWGTPHKRAGISAGQTQADAVGEPVVVVGDGGCHRHGFCADPGRVASRSRAPFPSPRSVPLGRLVGADRANNNHRPPQGGITR